MRQFFVYFIPIQISHKLGGSIDMGLYFYDNYDFQSKIRWAYTFATVYVIERTVGVIGKTTQVVLEGACTQF